MAKLKKGEILMVAWQINGGQVVRFRGLSFEDVSGIRTVIYRVRYL